MFEAQKTVLPNGLTLFTYVDTTVPTISYQTFINAGSRDETKPGATGIAHIFERMMFCGTDAYPDYSNAMAHMGAQTNAYTTEDYTCFFVNAKAGFLEEIIEVESDRVRNLRFTEETFHRELGSVKKERKQQIDDNPEGYLYQELYRLAFKKHTYHHPVMGWERDLEKNLTFKDAHHFKKIFYAPNYSTIVICGNFNPEKADEWVLKYYGDWKSSLPPISQVHSEPSQKKKRRRDFEWKDNSVSPRVLIGYKGPDLNFDTPDLVALKVLSNLLFSKTGRLYKRLKLDADAVKNIEGNIQGREDPGLFVIDATLKEGQEFDSILVIIDEELEKIKKDSIAENELARAVSQMKSSFLSKLDTPFRIGNLIGYYYSVGGDYRMMFTYYDMLSHITVENIKAVTRKYMIQSNSTIVTLSPLSSN